MGMMMKRIALFALLVTISLPSDAATITGTGFADIKWSPPSQRVDGATVGPDEIASYTVFWGQQSRFESGGGLRKGCDQKPATAVSTACYEGSKSAMVGDSLDVQLPISAEGSIYFAVIAVGKDGGWSGYSNEMVRKMKMVLTSTADLEPPVMTEALLKIDCKTDVPTLSCSFVIE